MPATDIYDTLIVPEGDVIFYDAAIEGSNTAFWLVSNYGAVMGPDDPTVLNPTLVNFGEINTVNNQTSPSAITDMIALFAGSSSFWVGVVVENHGLMTATSELGEARVFSSSSWSPSLVNTGAMIADSNQGLARTVWTYGLDLPSGPFFQPFFVHNTESGEIIADAAQAFAVASIFANFTNDGLVRAIGGGVAGIGVRSNGGYIENNGDIIATAGPGGTAWGICLGQADAFNGPRNTTLINTGLISAQIAIDELFNGGVSTNVTNSGQIVGNIIFYDGVDSIRNTGSIAGTINFGAGNDVFDGRGGAFTGDAIVFGDGDDTLYLGNHAGYMSGGGGLDVAFADYSGQSQAITYLDTGVGSAGIVIGAVAGPTLASFEYIRITGGNGYDNITTGGYDDIIDLQRGGGVGNGGGGDDIVIADFADRSGVVSYTHNGVEATVLVGGVSAAIIRNAEHVRLTGGSANDQLTGGAGDDTLAGGAGGDTLNGGDGVDIASYAGSNAAVTVTLGGAATGGHATGDTLSNFEGLLGSSFNDQLTGDDDSNYLNGGEGADTLIGGLGSDHFYVDNAGDTVTELADSGIDRVYATIGAALGAHVEELFLIGDADINGAGNDLANTILGNDGDNVIEGRGGGDAMDGGAGFDTISYANAAAGVNVNFGVGQGFSGDAQGDGFVNFEAALGSAFNDQLFGGSLSDSFEGGAGADLINGQDGYDTVTYRLSNQAVVINLFTASSQTQSGGHAQGDILQNIEGVVGSDHGDILIGSHANNELEGGAGDDWLSSYGGNDRVDGGDGYDWVSYEWFSERGISVDLERGLAAEYTATDILISIEAVIGTAHGDRLIGNGGANTLNGQLGNDELIGGAGADTLYGGAGVDVAGYAVSSGASSWHRNPDGTWTVTAQGVDTLDRVEFLDFTDRDVFLDRAYSTFSGDGTSDVFMRHASGTMGIWFVNGSGATGAAGLGSLDATWAIEGVGDFNGDGRDDIFMRHTSSGNLGTWFMDGAVATGASSFGAIDMSWGVEGIGDLDGNGSDDVVLWHSSGSLGVWFTNDGAVSGAAGLGTVSQATWDFEGLGDFNGDGKDDILLRNDVGNLGIWFMNGATATGATAGDIDASWTIEGVGDFNGDGRDDILLRDTNGNVGAWFMNGASATGVGLGNVDSSFAVAGIGDYNGDGRDDILWWNDNGALSAWFMNGMAASSTTYGVVSYDWVINPGG